MMIPTAGPRLSARRISRPGRPLLLRQGRPTWAGRNNVRDVRIEKSGSGESPGKIPRQTDRRWILRLGWRIRIMERWRDEDPQRPPAGDDSHGQNLVVPRLSIGRKGDDAHGYLAVALIPDMAAKIAQDDHRRHGQPSRDRPHSSVASWCTGFPRPPHAPGSCHEDKEGNGQKGKFSHGPIGLRWRPRRGFGSQRKITTHTPRPPNEDKGSPQGQKKSSAPREEGDQLMLTAFLLLRGRLRKGGSGIRIDFTAPWRRMRRAPAGMVILMGQTMGAKWSTRSLPFEKIPQAISQPFTRIARRKIEENPGEEIGPPPWCGG